MIIKWQVLNIGFFCILDFNFMVLGYKLALKACLNRSIFADLLGITLLFYD